MRVKLNKCLKITRKTPLFPSKVQHSLSSHYQTSRSLSEILCCTSCLKLNLHKQKKTCTAPPNFVYRSRQYGTNSLGCRTNCFAHNRGLNQHFSQCLILRRLNPVWHVSIYFFQPLKYS